MNARIRTAVYTTLAGIAMLSMSCSDDAENPVVPAVEADLAMFEGGGSMNVPTEPEQPYSIVVEFGVATEILEEDELPDPILFANRNAEDGVIFDATRQNTANFDVIVDRLTDGLDGSAYVVAKVTNGGSGSNMGPESAFFDYDPDIPRIGPDLQGAEITRIRVIAHVEVTPNGPNWLVSHQYTVAIIGRPGQIVPR